MKMPPIRAVSALPLLLLSNPLFADPPPAPKPRSPSQSTPEKSGSGWVFSLLPKSFQKNPRLEMTVITEMTAEGRKLPPVSLDNPAYYIAQPAGYHVFGDGPDSGKAPPAGALESMLKKALAANGYLPLKTPGRGPDLLVIYTWGAHYALHPDDDEAISADLVARNVLDRALLVGGQKFAAEMQKLFAQEDILAQSANTPVPPDGEAVLGSDQAAFMDPVHQFKLMNVKNEFLVEQMVDDLYYVVASAYDYAATARGQRKLLWRTRMTVGANGVAMADSLPTLVASAAPYFGREMDEPATLTQRAVDDGKVDVGAPRVVPEQTR
jgi:hypothetical protein